MKKLVLEVFDVVISTDKLFDPSSYPNGPGLYRVQYQDDPGTHEYMLVTGMTMWSMNSFEVTRFLDGCIHAKDDPVAASAPKATTGEVKWTLADVLKELSKICPVA